MRSERVLVAVAACLLAAGIGLGLVGGGAWHGVAMVLRWLGVVVLMVFAGRRRSVTPWIFVAMVAGAELGFDAPAVGVGLRVFSDIFLRLIKTIVAPLILATLVTGIAGHGDLKGVGRMGVKSIVYFEVVTTLALVVGLVAINISKAGVGLHVPAVVSGGEVVAAPPPTHWQDFLLHVFPENIAKSVAEGQILQVAVFAVFFGIALATLSEEKRAPVLRLCESLSEVMFKFTNVVMYFAPIRGGRGDGLYGRAHGTGRARESGQAAADDLWGTGGVWAAGAAADCVAVQGAGGEVSRRLSLSRLRLLLLRRRVRRRCRGRWSRWRRWGFGGGLCRS